MGTLMAIVLIALLGAVGWFFYTRTGSSSESQKQLPKGGGGDALDSGGDSEMTNLDIKDIVSHYDVDYMVEGKLTYTEGSWTWWEYRLVDGDDEKWLSAEEDAGLELYFWEEVTPNPVGTGEPPETIDYDGDEFRMVERGKAKVKKVGETGRKSAHEMQYFDYDGPGDRAFAVEKWGGETEAFVGEEVEEHELTVLPGDDLRSEL